MQITRTTALPAIASLALLASGCGGSGTPAGSGSSQNFSQAAFRYSACMRSNGITNFPDPVVSNGGNQISIHVVGSKRDPRFRAAVQACSGILPAPTGKGAGETAAQRRTRVADALSFARCMRGHNLPRFPDPNAHGDLSIETVQAQGINVHAPGFLQTVEACLPASHGALTPAKVREALTTAGG
jgi:hypothetical protein